MKDLVSVIIPAYNAERFIGQAIQSVLDQTYTNWELVIINDGSTDNTSEIVKEFDDPRIIYIFQENRGLSATRNTGIRNAKAEIIALLDSDDLWEPEFLEKMMGLIERHSDAAAIYCGFQYIDAQGQDIGIPSCKIIPPETVYKNLICEGNWLAPCAVVFRRRLAQEVGLFDESLMAVEDADLWIKLSALHHFIGLPEVLVKYRRHDGNMSKDPNRMVTANYQRTEKMFGPPVGNVSSWSNLKRCAYEKVFQIGARGYLASGIVEKSADNFQQLLEISPDSALSIGFWRGLVRTHLPDEQRNNPAAHPDWELAERDIFRLLRELSARENDSIPLQKLSSRLKGSAYMALAEEANQTNELRRAYKWLWRTATCCPYILFSRPYWGTIVRSFISVGKLDIPRKIFSRLIRKPRFHYNIVIKRELEDSLHTFQARIPFELKILPSDIEEVETRLAHLPIMHRPDIERRIRNGDLCFVAKHNDQIMCVIWTAFRKCYLYHLSREYELADNESYAYSVYTLPEFRGNGVYPAANCQRFQLLKEWGYRRDLGFVEPKNKVALRADNKIGYKRVGFSGFIEIFGLRWYFHKDRGAFSALKRLNYWRKM